MASAGESETCDTSQHTKQCTDSLIELALRQAVRVAALALAKNGQAAFQLKFVATTKKKHKRKGEGGKDIDVFTDAAEAFEWPANFSLVEIVCKAWDSGVDVLTKSSKHYLGKAQRQKIFPVLDVHTVKPDPSLGASILKLLKDAFELGMQCGKKCARTPTRTHSACGALPLLQTDLCHSCIAWPLPACAVRPIFCLGSCGGCRCLHHPSGALRGRLLKLVTRTCRQHNVHVMAVVSFADAHVYAGCSEACASAAFNWRSVAMLRCNASTTGSGKATAPGTSLAQEMNKAATALLECVTAQLNPDAGCADMQALLEAMSSQPTLPRFIAGVGWEPTRGCLVKLCQGNCPFGVFHKALATDGATTACANKIDGRPPGAGCGHVHSNGTAAVSPMSTFM